MRPAASWINPPSDITITCEEAGTSVITPVILGYTNNETGSCLIEGSVEGIIAGTYNECGGTLTQTWLFTDNCGSTIQHVQTITVLLPPVANWVNPPADATITCQEAINFALTPGILSYSNNGTGACLIEGSAVGVIAGTFDECGGALTQAWSFTDDCGNSIQYIQTITVLPAPQAQFAATEPSAQSNDADFVSVMCASRQQQSTVHGNGSDVQAEMPSLMFRV